MLNYRTGSFRNRAFLSVHVDSPRKRQRAIHTRLYPGGPDDPKPIPWPDFSLASQDRTPKQEQGLAIRVVNEFAGLFREMLPTLPKYETVPVFVSTAWPGNAELWVRFVDEALPKDKDVRDRIDVVCNPSRIYPWKASRPLRAPLRIACEPLLAHELFKVARYFANESVREHLVRFEAPRRSSRLPAADILVLSEHSDAPGLHVSPQRLATLSRRTRLVIVLDPHPESRFVMPQLLRPNVAVAVLPLMDGITASEALHVFLEEIVHDHRLSDALQIARRILKGNHAGTKLEASEWASRPRLYADPAANEALRLSTLIPRVRDTVAKIAPARYVANIDAFAERLSGQVPKPVEGELRQVFGELNSAAGNLQTALEKQVNFDRESLGLVPLADIAAAAAGVSQTIDRVTPQLERLLSDERVASALEHLQERRLDAELLRRSTDGATWPCSLDYPHAKEELRLRVHIGARGPNSLLVKEPPAIDPLVPPLRGDEYHELLITVFPKDFRLQSPATQSVSLSRLGGTAPVEWDLLAPYSVAAPPEEAQRGPLDVTGGLGWVVGTHATLRINVYFRNQLLQSFKLTVDVGPWRKLENGQRSVTLECDYSQTKRFGELDRFPPRLISLALNADQDTHTLMLAKDGASGAIRWDSGQLKGFTDAVRDELFKTMVDNGAPRFEFDSTTLALQPGSQAHFEPSVRALADAGVRLANQLFQMASYRPELKQLLAHVKTADSDVLQITATDANYAFPWPLIYDFDPPTGVSANPVCRGKLPNGNTCGCHVSTTSYCLRGFWGLRLVVEQRAPGPAPSGAKGRISATATNPVIGLVTSVTDVYIQSWLAATKLTLEAFPDTAKFLETFDDGAQRPNVIVFVGHHRNAGDDRLPDHQLLSSASVPILSLADFRRSTVHEWDSPRSLVFLLACASGAARADTGPSLATALLRFGAAGVLATECTVHTPMVARVSRDIMAKLGNGLGGHATVGSATRETLLELAQEGCPLGLAFTFHGIAEASLP